MGRYHQGLKIAAPYCAIRKMDKRRYTVDVIDLIGLTKDYRGIYRLLSYMNKDEGSKVNHCVARSSHTFQPV
jgi:hypothetical protein